MYYNTERSNLKPTYRNHSFCKCLKNLHFLLLNVGPKRLHWKALSSNKTCKQTNKIRDVLSRKLIKNPDNRLPDPADLVLSNQHGLEAAPNGASDRHDGAVGPLFPLLNGVCNGSDALKLSLPLQEVYTLIHGSVRCPWMETFPIA